ncbi:hypothetical protein GU926_00105 [Nibribacter ruber]|uniref:Cyclophilin-like domain-containing protein n=2 Tax=Nibribacter ruber TaxID=2698458 RepID=A0A6P1NVC7_9BACT|nr:hypothetical protein GU926_00105 [Nibribacter ruber]
MRTGTILFLMLFSLQLLACTVNKKKNIEPDTPNSTSMKLRITVGQKKFVATLYDNATATAFKAQLPMTLNMTELNENEKYFDLPSSLPTNASSPGTIQPGDLMLFGANTLVLFYKELTTPYQYTRLGRIDDPTGLSTALGSGNVTVAFELDK